MCATNDAKSPKSPLRRVSDADRAGQCARDAPVVWLGERRLLVAEQPAVAVGRVDDVHVAPLQRTRRRGERRLGELALVRVRVVVVRVAVILARAREGAGGAEREQAEQRRRELRHRRLRRWRRLEGGRARATPSSADALGTPALYSARPAMCTLR